MIVKSFKTELKVNKKQRTILNQHVGSCRFIFNWALNQQKTIIDNNKINNTKNYILSYQDLSSKLTQLKKDEKYKWLRDTSACSLQNSLKNCETAFKNFFKRCKDKNIVKKGFPKFKSKKNENKSFKLSGRIYIFSDYIILPKIGKVKLHQKDYIPVDEKVLSATISERAGRWFVSVNMECSNLQTKSKLTENIIGVDLGIKTLAVTYDGNRSKYYENAKSLKKNIKKLKRKSRQLSKKKQGSNNYKKAKLKLARLHYRISNIRKDNINKVTSEITNENQVIVLENLAISNMLKNRKLSRAISDASFYEFRRQIEYKSKFKNRKVVIADRFYPSSKTDYKTGENIKNLKLSDRFIYHKDGSKTCRDLNAAINLRNYYFKKHNTAGQAESEKLTS